uniref:Uncharacterized protein n=1 Tax=Ananas comosus var. bracteatus TaxID=296719 RepID=A0A6V7P1Y5_ANACO|nr:unnamed protein product [Ananas comosus var. bracteatus]
MCGESRLSQGLKDKVIAFYLIMPNSYLRRDCTSKYSLPMDEVKLLLFHRTRAISRMCNISSYSTELLEINSKEPLMQILFIPGNPGIVSFYRDFLEALYENLEGHASITAIGHISQGERIWSAERCFPCKNKLVIRSIILNKSSELVNFDSIRLQHQVKYFIGLYPFLTLNKESEKQALIGKIAGSAIISAAVSSFASLVAIDATCKHLLQYHTMRNVLFMAMTEFRKLSEEPDWEFMKRKQSQIALLFGVDDHWGPLSVFEEVSTRVPGIALSIEREGHTHGYCCTEAGSVWVACHVANLIKNQIQIRNL